jgi:hypothetical protein
MQNAREYVVSLTKYLHTFDDDLIVEREAQGGVVSVFAQQRTGGRGWISVSAYLSSVTGRWSLGDARVVYVSGGKVRKLKRRSDIRSAMQVIARDYGI